MVDQKVLHVAVSAHQRNIGGLRVGFRATVLAHSEHKGERSQPPFCVSAGQSLCVAVCVALRGAAAHQQAVAGSHLPQRLPVLHQLRQWRISTSKRVLLVLKQIKVRLCSSRLSCNASRAGAAHCQSLKAGTAFAHLSLALENIVQLVAAVLREAGADRGRSPAATAAAVQLQSDRERQLVSLRLHRAHQTSALCVKEAI